MQKERRFVRFPELTPQLLLPVSELRRMPTYGVGSDMAVTRLRGRMSVQWVST